jgi:plasmid stabilization system protein ParE
MDGIWHFIAADSEEAADRVETEIVRSCHQLASSPLIGHKRTDITNLPVRFWTLPRYPDYVIVYRPQTRPLQILAILHGRQDLKRRIGDRQLR